MEEEGYSNDWFLDDVNSSLNTVLAMIKTDTQQLPQLELLGQIRQCLECLACSSPEEMASQRVRFVSLSWPADLRVVLQRIFRTFGIPEDYVRLSYEMSNFASQTLGNDWLRSDLKFLKLLASLSSGRLRVILDEPDKVDIDQLIACLQLQEFFIGCVEDDAEWLGDDEFVVATENNQYLASDKNKPGLECSVASNTPTACVASTAATICSFQSGSTASNRNSPLTTTKNININISHQVTLRKMSIQPPPVARIAPKSAKPKLIPIHHQVVPSSNNENGKNIINLKQQQIPQVEMSSNLGGSSSNNSSNSSSPIIIQTSINSQSSKNISTTTCGSLTTAPKIVFTLKPAPISSVVGGGGIMDNNNKRPNQLIATTTTSNNNSNLFEDSSKMSCSSSVNSNQFPSSSPLLDSNDLLTNTVNKVASGANISPTNLEEGTSTKTLMSSTSTSSTTTNLPLTKPKQPKKKAAIKPKILVDEQRKNSVKIQPAVAVPCISPQIFGASHPQAQIASIPMESSVVADTTPTAAAICNSTGQTFPSTGMLLPSNSQFALASNGNLFSNYGTNFVIRQQGISSSPTKAVVASPQTPTTANLMTARNVFFHTGNGLFMRMNF
uniref:Negative elongation factor A n=1 Tax=Meloidogyne javanica TaxID=6303 RepID=A0A915LXL1_MELJA